MLNESEIDFISDKQIFITKNGIDSKVNQLLYDTQRSLVEHWTKTDKWFIPPTISRIPSKISKGNNHLGFPYQVFDFPSIFEKENIFSFRVMVWYGNQFSFNLILKGFFVGYFEERLNSLDKGITHLSLNKDIWNSESLIKESLILNHETLDTVKGHFQENESVRLFRAFKMNQISELNRLTIDCFIDWFKM